MRIFYIFFKTPNISRLNKNDFRIYTKSLIFVSKKTKITESSRSFNFLSSEASIDEIGWNSTRVPKLWLYNLHYLDCLNSIESPNYKWNVDLLDDWIKMNKPFNGVGWDPYPTSLRIVNIIKWNLNGNPLEDNHKNSLEIQARYLFKKIEYHILGNHIFANAKALIFASFVFEGNESRRWLKKGLVILNREIDEQILSDGGHFERSPMYHSIILEDLLDILCLAELNQNFFSKNIIDKIKDTSSNMIKFLKDLTHPNGEISHFNDSAQNISSSLAEIIDYARSLDVTIENINASCNLYFNHYKNSGYVNIRSVDMNLILDCAKVGPDYLPGHAHADTLSFELSVFSERFIVNSGTSTYEENSRRHIERSTSSHSTVVINEENSSEVWKSFRVARRAYPYNFSYEHSSEYTEISCSHNGYKRLSGSPVHERNWKVKNNSIIVSDNVHGNFNKAVSRYILHPNVSIVTAAFDKIHLRSSNNNEVLFEVLNGECTIASVDYAEEFGNIINTKCICILLEDSSSKVRLSW